MLLEKIWEYREETLYPRLFGQQVDGIYVLSQELFLEKFQQTDIDPRWLHLGVLVFQPNEQRDSWLYVTSGGSTPWEEDNESEYSWLGCEFVIETPDKNTWAVQLLQNLLAYQVLLAHGRYGDMPMLDYGDRIPTGSVDGSDTNVTNLVLRKPVYFDTTMKLESGKFDFIHVLGISDNEKNYAKKHGHDALLALLKQHHIDTLTDPKRHSIV